MLSNSKLLKDGFDDTPRSFVRTIPLRRTRGIEDRIRVVRKAITLAVAHSRPAHAVIGRSVRDSPATRRIRERLIRVLRARGVAITILPYREMRAFATGSAKCPQDALAIALRRTLYPQLPEPPQDTKRREPRRYAEASWNALGLAVWGLAKTTPLAMYAVVTAEGHRTHLGNELMNLARERAHFYATHPVPSVR